MKPASGLHVIHLCGDTPQHPSEFGAGLMSRSVPQTLRPAPEGAAFAEEGPARTLNRRLWFHVQARKADRPRLSACTSNATNSASLQGAVFYFGNLAGRSSDEKRQQVRVRVWRASP